MAGRKTNDWGHSLTGERNVRNVEVTVRFCLAPLSPPNIQTGIHHLKDCHATPLLLTTVNIYV